jgi:hypothetical protein
VGRDTTKPLIFAYCSAREGISDEQLRSERARLADFVTDEGYALGGIFVEPSEEPSVALQAMLDSAKRRDVRVVVVPAMTDLGIAAVVQRATRRRLDSAGIRVLVLVGGA